MTFAFSVMSILFCCPLPFLSSSFWILLRSLWTSSLSSSASCLACYNCSSRTVLSLSLCHPTAVVVDTDPLLNLSSFFKPYLCFFLICQCPAKCIYDSTIIVPHYLSLLISYVSVQSTDELMNILSFTDVIITKFLAHP